MRDALSRAELLLLLFCTPLLLLGLFGPPVADPAGYHAFADQRTLWGVPYAADVLSNAAFAALAVAGGALLWRARRGLQPVQRAGAALFLLGLGATALGSSWYHLAPDAAGLAIDRLAMALAFAGLLALFAASHVSERAGAVLGATLAVAAPLAALTALRSGQALPWLLVQLGGCTLLLIGTQLPRRPRALAVRWGFVLAAYALAKLCELADGWIFAASGQWVSGHTLKHLLAAAAALPVLAALARRQNGPQPAGPAPWNPHGTGNA